MCQQNILPLNGFMVTVTLAQNVAWKDLDEEDQVDGPLRKGATSRTSYYYDTYTEDEALDEFHESIPISCLEDYVIIPEPIPLGMFGKPLMH